VSFKQNMPSPEEAVTEGVGYKVIVITSSVEQPVASTIPIYYSDFFWKEKIILPILRESKLKKVKFSEQFYF
ncbi:hypothetical protein N8987_04575, partial [Crocinitomix sp.]|nr:hypothetical protein [Crocinitomix sp.]